MVFARTKKARIVAPLPLPQQPDSLVFGPGISAMMLDMLPVPAALVELQDDAFVFDAVNRSFRVAGLGTVASESPLIRLLGARLRRFIESNEIQCEISWQFGEEVDARHFRVMLAKRADRRSFPRCM